MTSTSTFEIFLVASPGHEQALCDEAKSKGFASAKPVIGGVTLQGRWPDVWKANLVLRGTGRVLARIGEFRAPHLAKLDKQARKFPWAEFLRADVPLRVEVTCKRSRIYHAGAAAERIETALREELRAPLSKDADLCIKARIEDDLCTISIDTSGDMLHKRGHKEAIGKAPLRETLAALFLRQCGYDGTEPVLDPMCGSGTFVIEAAEMAVGLNPGRSRSFAFEQLKGFDSTAWQKLRDAPPASQTNTECFGSDRDAGAIKMSTANAKRAGVEAITQFQQKSISELTPPEGPPGLVIVNPPYGTRIGDKSQLRDLYAALGKTLNSKFSGWRVGLITTEVSLAKITGLPFAAHGKPVSHGGLKVFLFQTKPLP
jgi:putative N6-adenine-specific DNA methylase